MKLLIESTGSIVSVDGVSCRVWKGTTEDGRECLVLVHRIAVPPGTEAFDFGVELDEQAPPLNQGKLTPQFDHILGRAGDQA